jgi:membrane protease YdiL (CAAX protease family)
MDLAAPAVPGGPLTKQEMRRRGIDWSGRQVFFALLWAVGALIVVPLPVVIPVLATAGEDSRAYYITAVLASGLVYVALCAIVWAFSAGRCAAGPLSNSAALAKLGFLRPSWATLGWAAAAFAGAYAASAAYAGVIELFDIDSMRQACDDQVPLEIREDRLLIGISAVVVVLFAPVTEELFYRGFTQPGLARSFGVAAGIAGSGLIFGLSHLVANPVLYKTLPLFVAVGVVLGLAYWRSGNLLSTIGAHMAFNALGVIALLTTTCEP